MNTIKNEIRLIGNVGQEPVLKNLENDKCICKLSVATNESYKDSNGNKVENTEWHNVTAWDNQAIFISKFIKKGMLVAVTGKMTTRTYQDESGQKKYYPEIRLNEILILSEKK